MYSSKPLPFITAFLEHIQAGLRKHDPKYTLTASQMFWLGFCLMGMLVTNTICWAKFERMSLGAYSKQALAWVFRRSKIQWDKLLEASVRSVLEKYGISQGILVVDDKNHARSKGAKNLHHLHKMKDKNTGGFLWGQSLICLFLATKKFCFPLSFKFYAPDPALQAWEKENRRLRAQKVPKAERPKAPLRSDDYLKKHELAVLLLKDFQKKFPKFNVICVLADALYGNKTFLEQVDAIWPDVQVITQLRRNQNLGKGASKIACEECFDVSHLQKQTVSIRGRKNVEVELNSTCEYVQAHKAKRLVIGLRYLGENKCRYLMATNLSWDVRTIVQVYSVRWIIEVFFEDWSLYNGFCSLAKQCGVEGSERPLVLSLLFDHCFLFHPDQQAFIENKLPLATFGSLVEKSRFDALCAFIQHILESEDPKENLKMLMEYAKEIFVSRPSKKHFNEIPVEWGGDPPVAA